MVNFAAALPAMLDQPQIVTAQSQLRLVTLTTRFWTIASARFADCGIATAGSPPPSAAGPQTWAELSARESGAGGM